MTQFKVGDWVREVDTEYNTVSKITDIRGESIRVDNIHVYSLDSGDKLELWQPKVGEWCWDSEYGFVKYINTINGITKLLTLKNYEKLGEIENLEPYIGELPSFIKD